MAIRAALFDIDGTLVDSNYLHVDAWSRAFVDVGHPVDAWRIHRSIGMDGEKLLDTLLADADDETRARATKRHDRHHESNSDRLRPFHGAREVLNELSSRGIIVVLATSAPEKELQNLRKVLDVDDLVDVVTSAEDVDTAKPSPDIVEVALERASVSPNEAIMVGDSTWDMQAASRAGVTAIGVLSGGISADALRAAGASRVYADVEDLREHLDDTLAADDADMPTKGKP
jgi:HAD superfamily hydrolase (TIGR01509 family)